MINKIGYEQSGNLYLQSNSFKKLIKKYCNNTIIDNTENSDLIIKAPLSGNVWNISKKPYIYWSGENRYVVHSKYHTKYLEILTLISNNPCSLYIPFCLESNHIYPTLEKYEIIGDLSDP